MTEKPPRLIALAFGVGMLVWSLGLFGPAAILPYLQSERGWSVAMISAAITAHFLASALVVAAMPEIHRAIGLRGTVMAGAIAIYAGFIAWVTIPLPYFLFFAALLSGCGLACGSSATVNAIISAGFSTGRAKALEHRAERDRARRRRAAAAADPSAGARSGWNGRSRF